MKQSKEYEQIKHMFPPVFDKDSKVLILGTFPSVKSREQQFFYGHPQNRFWKIIAAVTGEKVPEEIAEKKELLLKHRIAIWDVIESCDITGSSDNSIKNVIPADLSVILDYCRIEKIYANGAKAYQLYQKYTFPITKREIIQLPSSSPANAAYSMERLLTHWNVITAV